MAIWANDAKEGDLVEYTSTVTSVREDILYRHTGKCKKCSCWYLTHINEDKRVSGMRYLSLSFYTLQTLWVDELGSRQKIKTNYALGLIIVIFVKVLVSI